MVVLKIDRHQGGIRRNGICDGLYPFRGVRPPASIIKPTELVTGEIDLHDGQKLVSANPASPLPWYSKYF